LGELSEKIEGIGLVYEGRLSETGIATLEDLQGINVEKTSRETGISPTLLKRWQAMALLQRIEGIDPQLSEALVRLGIKGFQELVDASPQEIVEGMMSLEPKHIIFLTR
jgi:predicted flap endonuclease-1-like 5' DNA nuclease